MKRILTRYLPIYAKAVIYMLQKSEYSLTAFWSWYFRVLDWRAVMYRGQLVFTPVASLLYVIFVLIQSIVYLYAVAAWLIIDRVTPAGELMFYIYLLLWLYAAPLIATGLFMLPLIAAKILNKPYVWWQLRRAKAILSTHPATKIAVAGSYGKTSMKEMLWNILREGKNVAATTGNMNTPVAIARFARRLTGEEEILIVEFGEYRPGDIRKFARLVEPDFGIITGVNEAHLSNFRSLEVTLENIFTLEKFVAPDSLYVNGESGLASQRAGGAVLYSQKGVGEFKASAAKTDLKGLRFTAKQGESSIKVSLPLPGLHHIGPACAAIDLAKRLGLSDDQIKKGLGSISPYPGRLETRPRAGGVTVLNDTYNGNPDGVRVAIEFFARLKAKRKIYVTPGLVEMGPRTREVHEAIGQQLAKAGIDEIYLMENSVTPIIAELLEASGYKGKLHWVDKPKELYENLDLITRTGDVILLQNDWTDNYA